MILLVVPAHALDFDVLIGCNLYQDPELAALTDQNGTKVIRRQVPGVHRIFEDSTSCAYAVPSEFADVIATFLNQYSEMITTGYKVPTN